MKKSILIMLLSTLLYSDFTLTYRINNKIIQTTYYKDSNHTLVIFKENNKTLQELLILDNKKYIKFSENGKDKIYEIPKKSENIDINYTKKIDYKIVEVQENGGYDFKTQKWIIKRGDKNETVIVSNDKKIYPKVQKLVYSLRKLLPKDVEEKATIFDMGKGYALVKSNQIELLSHNEKNITLATFDIGIKDKKLKYIAQNIQKCSMHICCGNTKDIAKSKELVKYIKINSTKWKLLNIASCKNSSSLENAIVTNSNDYIVVDLNEDSISKIDTLKKEGVPIYEVKEKDIDGFKVKYTYIPEIDTTVGDIKLTNKTISIYAKGDVDILNFIKEKMELKKPHNYTLSN